MQSGSLEELRLHLITVEPLGSVLPDGVEVLFQSDEVASRAFEQMAYPQGFVLAPDRTVAREFPNT